jgi:hypothetical protein
MRQISLAEIQANKSLFSYAARVSQSFISKGKKFVHYCDASAAVSIIENDTVWMRNSQLMNDFSEIEYGTHCLKCALKSSAGEKLKRMLKQASPEMASILDELDGQLPLLKAGTFIFCLSEHEESENENGRLSMWRAYGEQDGVAIVVKSEPFLRGIADISPVGYLTEKQFLSEFSAVVATLPQITSSLPPDVLKDRLMTALVFSVMCTKHPGFHEEKEWRLVYRPFLNEASLMTKAQVTINGTSETIYKIPLKNRSDVGIDGIEVRDLVDRVIIGPSNRSKELQEQLSALLVRKGIVVGEKNVVASNIPFRRKVFPATTTL